VDAGSVVGVDAGMDAGGADAWVPPDGGAVDAGCAGLECVGVTDLVVRMNGVQRPLTRAQVGLEHAGGVVTRLYVEAHAGGDPACPSEQSPTPDRTLIISGIPAGSAGARYTHADGVRVVLLDFVGDLLSSPAPARASTVELAIQAVATDSVQGAFLSAVLTAGFDGGTVEGHVGATHCESLDD
jgi:hypothetical protein